MYIYIYIYITIIIIIIINLLKNISSLWPHIIITTTIPNEFSGSCTDYYNFVDILVGFYVVVVVVVFVVVVVVAAVVVIILRDIPNSITPQSTLRLLPILVGLLVLPCTRQCRRSPLTPSPLFFSCPGHRNRRRPVPVPVTGVRYNSLL